MAACRRDRGVRFAIANRIIAAGLLVSLAVLIRLLLRK
jgi:hypothetical protein